MDRAQAQEEVAFIKKVMEDSQRTEIGERFSTIYLQKRILSLCIADIHRYNQPELTHALRSRIHDLL